jgi:hypothetical protein
MLYRYNEVDSKHELFQFKGDFTFENVNEWVNEHKYPLEESLET